MLYHIDVDIDYVSLGSRRAEILQAEWRRTEDLIAAGIAVAEWRKANGQGVIAVWDCASHDELSRILASLPLTPYFRRVDVMPLTDHPLWPGGRLRHGKDLTAAGSKA
jgi:muconolactone delta-isomerase